MSHPFLEGLTGGGDGSHPFLAGLTSDGSDPRLETAGGRQLAQNENISENIAKLTDIMNRSETTPEHKARIKKIIEGMQRTDQGRLAEIDKSNLPSPSLGSGFLKGLMLPAKVVGAAAGMVGSSKGQQLVDKISEAESTVDEGTPSRGSTDEKALEMIGNMAGSAPGLGPLAEITGAPLAAAGGKLFPAAAKAITGAIEAGGAKGVAAGAASTVAKGLPLNYLFTKTGDDTGNPADRAKQMAIQAGADALFGGLGGAAGREKVPGSKPIVPKDAVAAAKAEGPATDLSAETQAALAAQKAKTDATVAKLEVRKKATRLARAEFELTHQDKKFNDLDKEVRKTLIDAKEQLLGAGEQAPAEGTAGATAAAPVVSSAEAVAPKLTDAEMLAQEETPQFVPGKSIATATNRSPELQQVAEMVGKNGAKPADVVPANTNLNQQPVATTAPLDPLSAKLAELKARVAKGETAATAFPAEVKPAEQQSKFVSWDDVKHAREMSDELGQTEGTKPLELKATNQTMSAQELQGLNFFSHGPEEQVNLLKRLGAMRRFVQEGGELPEMNNARLGMAVDKAVKDVKDAAHYHNLTSKDIETHLNDPNFEPQNVVANRVQTARKLKNRFESMVSYAAHTISNGDPVVLNKTGIRDLAEQTGKTPDEIETAINEALPGVVEKRLVDAKKTSVSHPQESTRKFFSERVVNLQNYLDELQGSATTEPAISSPDATAVTPGAEPPILPQVAAKSYDEMSVKEIDKLKDKLFDRLDENPDDAAAMAELEKLAQVTKQRKLNDLTPEEVAAREKAGQERQATKLDEVAPVDEAAPIEEPIPEMQQSVETPVATTSPIKPAKNSEYVELSKIPSRTKSTPQLKRFLDLADEYLQQLPKDGLDYKGVRSMMDKAATELAKRAKYDQGPVIAQMPPGVGGFVAGFAGGYVTTDDDADKVTNGLIWGAIGAGVAQHAFGHSVFRPEKVEAPLPAWEAAAAKKVINAADRTKQPMSLMAMAQRAYQLMIRGTSGLDYFVDAMKASRLPAFRNPAKLASMRGEWLSKADGWIMGRPQTIGIDPATGAPVLVDLPIKSIKEIYDSVHGDTDKLGRVLVAYASNELRGKKSVPFDQVTADLVLGNAPEPFHQAARDIRQVHAALIDELVKSDIISEAGRQKMLEEVAYAPLWKVFDQTSHIDAKGNKIIGSASPVKARGKGSEAPVKNPYESTIEMIAKTLNNAEVNNIKRTTIDLAETNPKLAGGFIQRVRKGVNPVTPEIAARVAELKADIKGLSDADAQGLVTAFDHSAVSKNNIMTAYRNGVIQSYQLSDPLALTMRSLNSAERPVWLELLGVPSQIARRGVTLHPWFVFMQAFRDSWQATMNSQYGFRFGVDSYLGWKNIVSRSPAYREMTGAGGGNSILQSRDFGNVQKSIESVQVGHGPNAFVDAWKNLKELHPLKAYEQLIVPFAESARMGEYMRARGHGSDVVDAVFAAKHVVGNFQQRGAAVSMQALNNLTMFLNPALQATDQAFYRMGAHPFRTPEEGRTAAAANYLSKAFATLVVPSYLFWLANHDDEEITNIRQTPGGSRFWYMRSPVDAGVFHKGEIIRIPKPQGDGQIFGTSTETALDNWKGSDEGGAARMLEALWGDMAPNILPQIGVLTAGIATNHDLGLGTPIVPEANAKMEPAYQDSRNTPELMRVVSKQLNPVTKEFGNEGFLGAIKRASTPAGLEFIVNNLGGMLGVDAVRGISNAIDYNEKGLAPIKSEAPIVGRFFQKTPTMYVRSVRDFYSTAERVDEVANTITELTKTKPELLGPYIEENQKYLPMISVYGQARQEIANYTRALDDLELLNSGTNGNEVQVLKEEYQRLIIDATKRANSISHAIKQ